MKKKTQTEKLIDKAVEKTAKAIHPTIIQNCEFVGAKFDESATDAVMKIAEGLVENAKALGNLAYVLKASNVEVETMLKIEG